MAAAEQVTTSADGARMRGGTGAHSWHSADYVRQWVADNEGRAEERRQQFDRLADYIPFAEDAAISVLDMGAGWGPVTRRVLERYPNARSTLLDYSEEMYAEARANLEGCADRVRYVLADLSQPGGIARAVETAGGTFDVVVSASFVHNLHDDERVNALYRELREALNPGGGFLNMDNMSAGSPLLQSVWQRGRLEQYRRRRLAETGTMPTVVEAEEALNGERRRRFGLGGQPSGSQHGHGRAHGQGHGQSQSDAPRRSGTARTAFQHLAWLHQAGFDDVECFWRQDQRTLIGAYVAQE
jgi:SAM-dependent methyltransferase